MAARKNSLPSPHAAAQGRNARNIQAPKDLKLISRRLMPPLLLGLFLLLALFYGFILYEHRANLRLETANEIANIPSEMQIMLELQAAGLGSTAETVVEIEGLRQALASADRDLLLKKTQPLYQRLHRHHNITHFYFHKPDRVNLLRVHKPEKSGDTIDRRTAKQAEATRDSSWGIEIGPLGTFTLRYVRPVFVDGALAGYVELGKEIEDLLQNLHETSHMELVLTVYKDKLNRSNWESGMAMLGRPADWDAYEESVVIHSSTQTIPNPIKNLIAEIGHQSGERKEKQFETKGDTPGDPPTYWTGVAIPLTDMSTQQVGNIIAQRDTTREQNQFEHFLVRAIAILLLLLIALTVILYVMLRRTDHAILDREGQMQVITRSAQDAIIMMDEKGAICFWNPAAENIFGHAESDVIGKDLHQILTPERFHADFEANFPHFTHTGEGNAIGKTLELVALHEDGHEIPVELSLSALPTRAGWRAVGIMRDISERKKHEQELEQSHRHLEETAANAEEMAAQAKSASQAKSEFLANMSHEIRTPMNGVIGMTNILLETELTDDQKHYVQTIESCGQGLLDIINDILDFSKIEAQHLQLEEIEFNLRNTIEDVAELLALRANQKNLEFISSIEPDTPVALIGDPGRLRQVITNLVGNAIKFTNEGEVAIHVACIEKGPKKVTLETSIKDTGIGIPQNKLNMLFDPFQQADTSVTRQFGGTGLGLTISKRLVELMDGEISVTSEEGKGSCFRFTVRLAQQASEPEPETLQLASIRGAHILVVDDNATNREVVKIMLDNWGAHYDMAESAEKALEILRASPRTSPKPHLAILDMQMPGMDGETLGKTIKGTPELADIALVMMTSIGQRGDAARLEEAGFEGYLTKPIRQSEFHDCLATIIHKAKEERSGKPQERKIVTRHTVRDARHLSHYRILLAEDNIVNQKVALKTLEQMGFAADVANDGAEAIAALEKRDYDLVLMDVQMPLLDGLEATRKIRAGDTAARNSQIPIIALTAHAMKGDRDRCIKAGMNDYVTKPIERKVLLEKIEAFLKPPEDTHPTNTPPPPQTSPEKAPSAQADSGKPVWDRADFMDRVMEDKELAHEILEEAFRNFPAQLNSIIENLTTGNLKNVERQAHSVKGMARNLAAEVVATEAAQLETLAREEKRDELEDAFIRLRAAVKTFREQVQQDTDFSDCC